ncbi:hypothetical protein GALLR39Z86_19380 [Glycomyces algeriensis]|uniref:Uncharacterized protein n=1 Tax=Glycomyces algeriensis TaxID=256037 RepID=A0A9W6LFY5_9ACTN|nr:hypothetical protein GALLR39Z86_19380 [Glycomyces algeriensis]
MIIKVNRIFLRRSGVRNALMKAESNAVPPEQDPLAGPMVLRGSTFSYQWACVVRSESVTRPRQTVVLAMGA